MLAQFGSLTRGVIEGVSPLERIERTHLDADAAVHAQAIVDREVIEHVHRAGAACSLVGDFLGMRGQVNTPSWAFPNAQHAGSAGLWVQRDHVALGHRITHRSPIPREHPGVVFSADVSSHFPLDQATESLRGPEEAISCVAEEDPPLCAAAGDQYSHVQ